MNKNIRIILLILGLAIALVVLTGCGNKTVDELKNNVNQIINKVENDTNQTAKEAIARGKIDENNVYTSEFADIKFSLPKGMRYADDTEIASMMNTGAEIISSNKDDITELLEKTSLYDMVAKDDIYGTSVMVLFEKATLNVNEEFYLQRVGAGLKSVTSMGYEVEDEVRTETLGGRKYKTLTATIPTYGLTQKYYTEKKDGYFISILVTYYDAYVNVNELLANFQ